MQGQKQTHPKGHRRLWPHSTYARRLATQHGTARGAGQGLRPCCRCLLLSACRRTVICSAESKARKERTSCRRLCRSMLQLPQASAALHCAVDWVGIEGKDWKLSCAGTGTCLVHKNTGLAYTPTTIHCVSSSSSVSACLRTGVQCMRLSSSVFDGINRLCKGGVSE